MSDQSYGGFVWICPECRSIYKEHQDTCERDDLPLAEVKAHQTRARYPLLDKVIDNRYQLIGGLGQGGLGTVYLARHLHLDQLFAVKFLDLETVGIDVDKGTKKEYQSDFMKEAKVAALLRHDSVVKVIDFGEYERLPYLVMEYVPGPSLLAMITERGRFTVPEAINIARRIAEALSAFHERRLVHRDLKPANVIMDPRGNGQLMLVDLGLVKDISGPAGRLSTHPMALRGTPGYLAPEQVPSWVLSGQGIDLPGAKKVVDGRVDLYALGVIFYEMIAGVSPYPDGSNTSIIVYACTRPPLPLTGVDPPIKLVSGLEDLIYRTMSRDPNQRPSTAADFIRQLERIGAGRATETSWPVMATTIGQAAPPKLILSRHRMASDAVQGGRAGSIPLYQAAADETDAVDIIDDEDAFATHISPDYGDAEDATVEFNPDDSFDGLLDDSNLEFATQVSSYSGSSDHMLTRVDTLDPSPRRRRSRDSLPSMGSHPSSVGPISPPSVQKLGETRSVRWMWILLPLVAIITGLGVYFFRTSVNTKTNPAPIRSKGTVSKSKASSDGKDDQVNNRRVIAPTVVVTDARTAETIDAGTKPAARVKVGKVPSGEQPKPGQAGPVVQIPKKPPSQPRAGKTQAAPDQNKRADGKKKGSGTVSPVRRAANATPKPSQKAVKPKTASSRRKGPAVKPVRRGTRPKAAKRRGKGGSRLNAQALDRLLQQANLAMRAGRYPLAVTDFKRWLRAVGKGHPMSATVQGRLKYCESKRQK